MEENETLLIALDIAVRDMNEFLRLYGIDAFYSAVYNGAFLIYKDLYLTSVFSDLNIEDTENYYSISEAFRLAYE